LIFPAEHRRFIAGRNFAISRRDAPEVVQEIVALENMRAWGMPGAQCTRSLACSEVKHTS